MTRLILTANEAQERGVPQFYGFDGNGYSIGDRVEIHPGTDLWMRGARFGTVIGASLTPNDRVRVQMDHAGKVSGTDDSFQRV